jgi:hypothetical protein
MEPRLAHHPHTPMPETRQRLADAHSPAYLHPNTTSWVAMTLINFKVNPTVEIDGTVVAIAEDGETQTRVVAFIQRIAIDDSFPQYHLTDDERVGLIESDSNRAVISRIISVKYARQETRPYHSFGSTLPLVAIAKGDLQRAPRLSDDYLLAAREAKFRQRS